MLVLAVLLYGCGVKTPTGNVVGTSNPDAVNVEFYVMSQCPYGTQVVDAFAPVKEQLGAAVNFQIDYIANDNGNGKFSSLHGENEVQGDIVQLCAAKYEPDKYLKMITCQDENAQAIPGNWESCAKSNGLDEEKIRACFTGEEGKQLLSASIVKSMAVNAQGSPTIYIGGEQYSGGRKSSDFLRAVCNKLIGEKPEACSSIPEPKTINVIYLNDKRCAECDISQLTGQLRSVFPGIKATELDYNTAEGKKLYDETKLKFLPAVLFDNTVKEDESYSNIQSYLVPAGSYLSLRIGASFDPTAEICDNGIDDTSDGKVDCADATCTSSMVCREEKPGNVQVFIMSDCPYGRKAIEALKENVDNFGSKMTYEVHYIASEDGDGFQSLHGQYEVDEDIVQLCVKKHSPGSSLDYLYCRSTKGVRGVDWKGCAEETGVNTDAVQACFDGNEGKDLLREDIKISNALMIGASPTWLANNKYTFSGIDAETVKQQFCARNTGLAGCENALSTASATGAVPSGACG